MNNNDPKFIHETMLSDIFNIWNATKDFASDVKNKNIIDRYKSNGKKLASPMANSSSIAKASSNLTLVFPVIASKSVSVANASLVCKALEKNFVSMLQRLFASWQIVDGNDVGNFKDYLAALHGNISSKSANLDDIFAMLNSTFDNDTERLTLNEANLIKNDMRNINYYLPSDINETALTDYNVRIDAITESAAVDKNTTNDNKEGGIFKNTDGSDIPTAKPSMIRKDSMATVSDTVLNGEYKKANELMPTTMVVNFSIATRDDNGNINGTVPYTSALAAVKAKLYPIASDDIIKHLVDKNSETNWFVNFIRATTREISFVKDFLLGIDKAKVDALSFSDKNKTSDKMWKVLERRAMLSKSHKFMRSGAAGSVAAITSLLISQDEVEYMKKYYNIDLERTSVVTNLFNAYNLISVCIVDENLEVAKFIFDEDEPSWEVISFNHLERESSDSTYKKVINLMTKVAK